MNPPPNRISKAEVARDAVKRFCIHVIERAGGREALAKELAVLGFDEYNPDSLANWASGNRAPSSAVLVSLALRYDVPLDEVISPQISQAELRRALRALDERISTLEGELLERSA